MTLVELADFLRVSPMTVRRMVAEGRIPYFRAGKRARFIPSQVLAAIGAYKK